MEVDRLGCPVALRIDRSQTRRPRLRRRSKAREKGNRVWLPCFGWCSLFRQASCMSAIFPLSKRAKLQRRRLGARPMWSRSLACRPVPESREIRDLLFPDKNKDAVRPSSPQTTSARSAYFAVFIHAVQTDRTISTNIRCHETVAGGFARSVPPIDPGHCASQAATPARPALH